MLTWQTYAIGTAIALATADFFVKLTSGRISNGVAMFVFGVCTFVMSSGYLLWQRASGVPQHAQGVGVLTAIGVGVFFSLVTIGLYTAFSLGAPVSVASPAVRIGGLTLVSIAGILLLREALTVRYIVGMALALAGVYLIITR
ncbi:MAG: hypothetical protein ACE5FI_09690 [Anaerolineales bacterium]